MCDEGAVLVTAYAVAVREATEGAGTVQESEEAFQKWSAHLTGCYGCAAVLLASLVKSGSGQPGTWGL